MQTSTKPHNPIDKRTFGYRYSTPDGSEIWASNKTYKTKKGAEQYMSKQKQHNNLRYKIFKSPVSQEWFTICLVIFK